MVFINFVGSHPDSEPGAVTLSSAGWTEDPATDGAAEGTQVGLITGVRGAEDVPEEAAADTSYCIKKRQTHRHDYKPLMRNVAYLCDPTILV